MNTLQLAQEITIPVLGEDSFDPYHQLNLGTDQLGNYHAWLMDKLSSDPATIEAMQPLAEAGDPGTIEHCYRVGHLMVGAALWLDLPAAEVSLAGRAGLVHDIGKSDPEIQAAIHSPQVISDDPTRYNQDNRFKAIRRHPEHGARLAQDMELDSNVRQLIRYHHALQPTRPYPRYRPNKLKPASFFNGQTPDLELLLSLAACADTYDAVTAERVLGARAYQQGQQGRLPEIPSREKVGSIIDEIRALPVAKTAIMAITEPSANF